MDDPKKILIVDDDADLRLVLRTTLERSGYDVVEASNGREGLSLITSYVPDLVILDILMHEMDGKEFCRRLVEDLRVRGVRVLIYSAISGNSKTVRDLLAIEELQTDFIHKPAGPVEIKVRLEQMLEGRRGGGAPASAPPHAPDAEEPPAAKLQGAGSANATAPAEPPQPEPRVAPERPSANSRSRPPLTPSSPSIDNRARLKPRTTEPSAGAEPRPATIAPKAELNSAPRSATPSQKAMPAATPSTSGKLRVLMVDDDLDLLSVLRFSLRDDYEIQTAQNGLDGLEVLEEFEPHFVIVDYNMPVMNGLEMVRMMRRHPRFRRIPAIFLSANTDQDLPRRAFEDGGNLFLRKPIDPSRLRKAIDLFVREAGIRYSTPTQDADRGVAPASGPPRATLKDSGAAGESRARLQPRSTGPTSRPAAPSPSAGVPRLLVVDHLAEQRSALARLIEQELPGQAELLMAPDYQTALSQLSRWQPDAILYNPKNPGLDGVAFYQMLKIKKLALTVEFAFVGFSFSPAEQQFSRQKFGRDCIALDNSAEKVAGEIYRLIQETAPNVKPKRYTIEQLQDEEERQRAKQREDAARQRQEQRNFERRYIKIQEFIDQEL